MLEIVVYSEALLLRVRIILLLHSLVCAGITKLFHPIYNFWEYSEKLLGGPKDEFTWSKISASNTN